MAVEPVEVAQAIWTTAKRLEVGADYIVSKAKE